jgi:hypothetical protein
MAGTGTGCALTARQLSEISENPDLEKRERYRDALLPEV